MLRLFTFLLIAGMLTACGQPRSTSLPTVTVSPFREPVSTVLSETPAASTEPVRVDLTPAQQAARQALAEAINISADQIHLINTEAAQWSDGCLGIVRINARCMGGPVEGFRVILEANGKPYEFHTNQDGTAVAQLEDKPYASFAIRQPDNSIQIVNTHIPLESHVTTGLLPLAGEASGAVYALGFTNQAQVVVMDQTGTRPLNFIHNPSYGLAVQASETPRLGWATAPVGTDEPSQLFTSLVDGSALTTLITDTTAITAPHILVAQRWSQDGQLLYFSTEPYGIGGYILFGGASSLQRVSLNDQSVQDLIPYNMNGRQALCLDELSWDERLVADHCAQSSITIRDLSRGRATAIQPPTNVTGFSLVGSARFSPDLTRVAFALAKRDPDNEQGWVAVSDGLSGGSTLIVTSQPGEYFTVIGWLNADTLLLQSNQVICSPNCASSLWTVSSTGTLLSKVAEGTFLSLIKP